MNNTNTPPRLYALTPIDQTEGLEDGWYLVKILLVPELQTTRFKNGQWDANYISFSEYYLRPLPEGTRVLQQGEVAVSEDLMADILLFVKTMAFSYPEWVPSEEKYDTQLGAEKLLTKLAQVGE